jgi:hypothetical protein
MLITWRDLLAAAFAAVMASSCGNSPPGGGFTNGDKATFTADEKPAVRDDLKMPTNPDSGDASLADSAASSPAASGNNAGSGGRNAGQAGNPPAPKAEASGEKPASSQTSSSPPATPPKVESSDAAGAQGGTKPTGDIKAGTPRSPQ